jgi:predicted transcriptional regulator
MSRTFSISMDAGLRKRAEKYAKANDRKMSDTMRVALREFLDRNDQASDSREGGTERTESAKVCAVPPTGN